MLTNSSFLRTYFGVSAFFLAAVMIWLLTLHRPLNGLLSMRATAIYLYIQSASRSQTADARQRDFAMARSLWQGQRTYELLKAKPPIMNQ